MFRTKDGAMFPFNKVEWKIKELYEGKVEEIMNIPFDYFDLIDRIAMWDFVKAPVREILFIFEYETKLVLDNLERISPDFIADKLHIISRNNIFWTDVEKMIKNMPEIYQEAFGRAYPYEQNVFTHPLLYFLGITFSEEHEEQMELLSLLSSPPNSRELRELAKTPESFQRRLVKSVEDYIFNDREKHYSNYIDYLIIIHQKRSNIDFNYKDRIMKTDRPDKLVSFLDLRGIVYRESASGTISITKIWYYSN